MLWRAKLQSSQVFFVYVRRACGKRSIAIVLPSATLVGYNSGDSGTKRKPVGPAIRLPSAANTQPFFLYCGTSRTSGQRRFFLGHFFYWPTKKNASAGVRSIFSRVFCQKHAAQYPVTVAKKKKQPGFLFFYTHTEIRTKKKKTSQPNRPVEEGNNKSTKFSKNHQKAQRYKSVYI